MFKQLIVHFGKKKRKILYLYKWRKFFFFRNLANLFLLKEFLENILKLNIGKLIEKLIMWNIAGAADLLKNFGRKIGVQFQRWKKKKKQIKLLQIETELFLSLFVFLFFVFFSFLFGCYIESVKKETGGLIAESNGKLLEFLDS
jgi:hypothetical protein